MPHKDHADYLAWKAKWREKNRERLAAESRSYYRIQANRERHNVSTQAWRKRNPQRTKQYALVDSYRRRGVVHTAEDKEFWLILRADPCSYCGRKSEVLEHIEPLAKDGGGDWPNLTAACHSCNSRKHTKSLLLFLLHNL